MENIKDICICKTLAETFNTENVIDECGCKILLKLKDDERDRKDIGSR